jgi:hypothetical protein
MPIRPFLSEQAFDPEAIEVTPAAFTAACDASAPYSPRLSHVSEYLFVWPLLDLPFAAIGTPYRGNLPALADQQRPPRRVRIRPPCAATH